MNPLVPSRRNIQRVNTTGAFSEITSISDDIPAQIPGSQQLAWAFKRDWKQLVFAVGMGALLGLAISIITKPVYEATTTVELQDTNADFLNMRSLDPNAPSSQFSVDKYVDTQVKVLESRNLIEKVLDKTPPPPKEEGGGLLARLLEHTQLRGVRWLDHLPAKLRPWFRAVSDRDQAIEEARSNLKVQASPTSRTVDITYSSVNAQAAADFANSVAREYIIRNGSLRSDSARQTDQFLTEHTQSLRVRLESLEKELDSYSHSSGLLLTSEKDNVAEEKLRQIQLELSKAQAERMERQAKLETAASADADSVPEVLDSKPLVEYHNRLADLKRQLAELNATFTPSHYKVQRMKVQVDELSSTVARERANILKRIQNDHKSSLRREGLIKAAYASQLAVVNEQSAKTVHYKMLKREVDTNRQIYEDMLRRVQDANVVSAIRASTVRIIDSAVPPSKPSKPRLGLNIVAGAFSGLWIGLLFLFFRNRAKRSFREPGDASLVLDAPELGAIPSVKQLGPADRGVTTILGKLRPFRKSNGSLRTGRSQSPAGIELLSWTEKPSALAESFRSTLASLQFQDVDTASKVIVMTSPSAGDGKTTVLTNLGIALAESGQKVLLIDCDLRQPRLHSIFSVPNSFGVSDLLSGRTPFAGAPLDELVFSTGIPGLSVLPSGPGTANISGLLKSPHTTEMLNHFSGYFDAILIDTPPMSFISDARILARKSDGVVLVLKANQTSRELAVTCAQRLKQDGSTLIGTILNDWDPASSLRPYEPAYYYRQTV